jgi:hypothetical protein
MIYEEKLKDYGLGIFLGDLGTTNYFFSLMEVISKVPDHLPYSQFQLCCLGRNLGCRREYKQEWLY